MNDQLCFEPDEPCGLAKVNWKNAKRRTDGDVWTFIMQSIQAEIGPFGGPEMNVNVRTGFRP
jgi:hypothetical protein